MANKRKIKRSLKLYKLSEILEELTTYYNINIDDFKLIDVPAKDTINTNSSNNLDFDIIYTIADQLGIDLIDLNTYTISLELFHDRYNLPNCIPGIKFKFKNDDTEYTLIGLDITQEITQIVYTDLNSVKFCDHTSCSDIILYQNQL